MFYDLVQIRRAKETIMMTDQLPKVNRRMKELRKSQRNGANGDQVKYLVRATTAEKSSIVKKVKGFSLIELLVIIGLLALLVVAYSYAMSSYHPPAPVVPVELAKNVWVFGPYQNQSSRIGQDTFAEDFAKFVSQHPDLRIVTEAGADYDGRGRAQKYVVTTEKKPIP